MPNRYETITSANRTLVINRLNEARQKHGLVGYAGAQNQITYTTEINSITAFLREAVIKAAVVNDVADFTVGEIINVDRINYLYNKSSEVFNKCTCEAYCSCDCNNCSCDCNRCSCDCNKCSCDCNRCACNCDHTDNPGCVSNCSMVSG